MACHDDVGNGKFPTFPKFPNPNEDTDMIHRPTEDEAFRRIEREAQLTHQVKPYLPLTEADVRLFHDDRNRRRSHFTALERGRLRLVMRLLVLLDLRQGER
jgi:hypothetical protein